MASNNYHWSSESAPPKRCGGKYDVDVVTLLASRLDALAQRLEKVGTSPALGGQTGPSVEVSTICETCGVQRHTSTECYNGLSTIKHVNAL